MSGGWHFFRGWHFSGWQGWHFIRLKVSARAPQGGACSEILTLLWVAGVALVVVPLQTRAHMTGFTGSPATHKTPEQVPPTLPGFDDPSDIPTAPDAGMPDWLIQHIETTTGAAPGARNAKAGRCRQCKARVLNGLSDDHCAFPATVDPTPLSRIGEALSLLDGRRTYDLTRSGDRWRLTRRHRWRIGGNAAQIHADTVAEHRCGSPPTQTTATVHRPDRIKEHHDECPF